MNKFYSVVFAFALTSMAFGQCEVDFDFGDVGFGISPDPVLGEALDPGTVNDDYFEVIHILIPAMASDIDDTYPPTLPIDSIILVNVVFTDTVTMIEYQAEQLGLEIVCNNLGDSPDPCTFMGALQYCVSVQGVPNTAAVYRVDLHVLGWLTIFEPFSAPAVFSNFLLNVQCDLVEDVVIIDADSDAGTLGSVDVNYSSNVADDATYTWTDADGNVVGTDMSLVDVGAGNYMLTVVSGDCTSYFENNIVIDLANSCALAGSVEVVNEVSDTSLGSIDLTLTGVTGIATYLWTDDNGITVGTDEDLIDLYMGYYSVTIIDEDECVLELNNIFVDAVEGINDLNSTTVWALQPNPANETFSIQSELFINTMITVVDISGRMVISEMLAPNSNWDVSAWENGVYFIQLSNEHGISTRKLVVQH